MVPVCGCRVNAPSTTQSAGWVAPSTTTNSALANSGSLGGGAAGGSDDSNGTMGCGRGEDPPPSANFRSAGVVGGSSASAIDPPIIRMNHPSHGWHAR